MSKRTSDFSYHNNVDRSSAQYDSLSTKSSLNLETSKIEGLHNNPDLHLSKDGVSISTISGNLDSCKNVEDPTNPETPEEKALRKRSHFIAYTTVCVMTIGFSVVLTGVWPYLHAMDPNRSRELLGWVVAANPFGQMIASPIAGYLANRIGRIREICYGTMITFTLGNLIYSFLPSMDWSDNSIYGLMIFARFLVGISSSNITLCRSYMAASTTVEERTTGIAILSAAQSSGFILGPLIQTIFTASIDDDVKKYQAAGWFAAALGVVNFILLTPWIFQEFNISEYEAHPKGIESSTNTSHPSSKPDLHSIGGLLSSYFFSMMIFVFMETLAVPLLTDQYGWENDKAIIVVGVLTICTGFVAIGMIVLLKKVLYNYDDRKILLLLGLIPISLGTFFYMPIYTNIQIPISNCTTKTESAMVGYSLFKYSQEELQQVLSTTSDDQNSNPYCTKGCPSSQTWCNDVSQIPLAQFLSANVLIVIGFPISSAIIIGIYSKTVGNRPQGMWMALLSVVLSFSRIVGPVFATYVYTRYGTIVSFGSLTIGMGIGLISYILIMNKLPKVNADT